MLEALTLVLILSLNWCRQMACKTVNRCIMHVGTKLHTVRPCACPCT